jgi:hypothetical protein
LHLRSLITGRAPSTREHCLGPCRLSRRWLRLGLCGALLVLLLGRAVWVVGTSRTIITANHRINNQSEILRERANCFVGSVSPTIYSFNLSKSPEQRKAAMTALWMFGKNISNFVLRSLSEYLTKSLGTLDALSGEAVGVLAVGFLWRLFAMADHVDDRSRLNRTSI